MFMEPSAGGVKLAEHEPLPRVQLWVAFVRPPPLAVKVTEPLGVLPMPTEVSVTVAEQPVPSRRSSDLLQEVIAVEVARLVTVTAVAAAVVLVVWVVSPPYEAV